MILVSLFLASVNGLSPGAFMSFIAAAITTSTTKVGGVLLGQFATTTYPAGEYSSANLLLLLIQPAGEYSSAIMCYYYLLSRLGSTPRPGTQTNDPDAHGWGVLPGQTYAKHKQ